MSIVVGDQRSAQYGKGATRSEGMWQLPTLGCYHFCPHVKMEERPGLFMRWPRCWLDVNCFYHMFSQTSNPFSVLVHSTIARV
jgi:hypothetical protein